MTNKEVFILISMRQPPILQGHQKYRFVARLQVPGSSPGPEQFLTAEVG